jgi:hypothetical protein
MVTRQKLFIFLLRVTYTVQPSGAAHNTKLNIQVRTKFYWLLTVLFVTYRLINYLIQWSTLLLQKLTVAQLINTFLVLFGTDNLFLCSEQVTTEPFTYHLRRAVLQKLTVA